MFDPSDARARGVNLPWFTYGCDFGANAWQPRGGLAHRGIAADARRTLEEAAARGITVVRWFLLCDGRAGIRFDGDRAAGMDEALLRDIDAGLAIAEAAGVRVVFVLFDFHWCRPARIETGVRLGGRRASLVRPDLRADLLERVVAPLLARYGAHRTIAAWDLFNEPEWVTWSLGAANPWTSIRPSVMRRFLAALANQARCVASQPLTVGLARAKWLGLVDGIDLDFYQVHWYDRIERGQLPPPVVEFAPDRPVVLGEFPTAGSRHAPDAIAAHAARAGYSAAWPWSLLASDDSTGRVAAWWTPEAERLARLARIDPSRGHEERRG